jgi:hypothetical protein
MVRRSLGGVLRTWCVPILVQSQLFLLTVAANGRVSTTICYWYRSKVSPDPNIQVVKIHAPSFDINIADGKGDFRPPGEVEGVSYGTH